MRIRLLLALALFALALVSNASAFQAPGALLEPRLILWGHDQWGWNTNPSDTSSCGATAPGAATCATGDLWCTGSGASLSCSTGYHTNHNGAFPFVHGVPQDCCPGFVGRIRSVVTHSGGQSVTQCDINQGNGTVHLRSCSGPLGPAPPPNWAMATMKHTCTTSSIFSNAGSGSGAWRCFITHP